MIECFNYQHTTIINLIKNVIINIIIIILVLTEEDRE